MAKKKGEPSSEKPDGQEYRWFRINEGMRAETHQVDHNIDQAAKSLEQSVKEMFIDRVMKHNSRLVDLQDEAESEGIYFFREDEDFMKEN